MEDTKDTKAIVKIPKKLEKHAIEMLDMIAGGADEKAICDHYNIRRGTFVQWMITYPQFEKAVVEARKQRADSYRSLIHERLYEDEIEYDGPDDFEGKPTGRKVLRNIHKDYVPGEKLIFEKLKWLAEVDNPEKYGTRVKHEGGSTMPVKIIVDTGIKQQENKEAPIEAEVVEKSDDYEDMDF